MVMRTSLEQWKLLMGAVVGLLGYQLWKEFEESRGPPPIPIQSWDRYKDAIVEKDRRIEEAEHKSK